MTDTVYIPWNTGLGDHIATLQLLAHLGRATRERVQLSTGHNGLDFRPRLEEICALIPGSGIPELVSHPGNTPLDGFNIWATPYMKIPDPWYWLGAHRHVTYQFDGISSPQKNPPREQQAIILDHLERVLGYTCIPVGKGRPLAECAELLATSAFFVGCDSGVSHLAHMTGVPLFLLEYGLPVVTCHRGKEYILCSGAADFIENKLKTWLNYRKFLGLA